MDGSNPKKRWTNLETKLLIAKVMFSRNSFTLAYQTPFKPTICECVRPRLNRRMGINLCKHTVSPLHPT